MRPPRGLSGPGDEKAQSPDSVGTNKAAVRNWTFEESQKNSEVISQLSPQGVGPNWLLITLLRSHWF